MASEQQPPEEDDAARRQREMSLFAAMAAGGSFIDTSTRTKSPSTPSPRPPQQSDSTQFADAASAVVNAGTFNMSKSSRAPSSAASSNLEAALAALTGEEPSPPKPSVESPRLSAEVYSAIRPKTKATSMQSEKVLMPRPLFFGPVLPPRVLKETREAVANALSDNQEKSLSSLPPELRNVVGAIETFGFGLSVFPGESKAEDETDEAYWRGSPYISTYQPVFGDEARAEREKIFAEKHPKTEPSEALREASPVSKLAAGETTMEFGTPATKAGQPTSDERDEKVAADMKTPAISNKTVRPIKENGSGPDQNMFSMWARGESNGSFDSVDGEDKTEVDSSAAKVKETPVSSEQSMFSQWARGEDDDDGMSNAAAENKKEKPAVSSEQSMFSQWARGEDDDGMSKASGVKEGKAALSSEQSMFSQWARGEDDGDGMSKATDVKEEKPAVSSEQSMFSQWARGEDDGDGMSKATDVKQEKPQPAAPSEQSMFSQWARGEGDNMNRAAAGGSFISVASDIPTSGFSDSFRVTQQRPHDADDDESSVVGSELKKQVGMNEHLSAAVASLASESGGTNSAGVAGPTGSLTAEESHALLSQLCPTTPGGRPFSNLELTNGCVPLFACDDSPLPIEADLGMFQTKEDQVRSMERKKSQEIIAKHTLPNFFGTISCPNPALQPDDVQSWNSRTVPVRRLVGGNSGASYISSRSSPVSQSSKPSESPSTALGRLPPVTPLGRNKSNVSSSSPASIADSKASARKRRKSTLPRFDANTRFGWWNVEDDGVTAFVAGKEGTPTSPGEPVSPEQVNPTEPPLQLPPIDHPATALHQNTRLTPTPEQLHEENLPLSRLHSATSTAGALPFLSDRPPSYRYIQIDAQGVGFPDIGGEIEPLFCTLAVYHVETMSVGGNNPKTAPVPNLQRCGRVTEVLNFDIVATEDTERRCVGALWPYATSLQANSNRAEFMSSSEFKAGNGEVPQSERTHGTRCGVFPIPSNLNISNLYAILIVHKVFSDISDINVYMDGSDGKNPAPKYASSDIGRLITKAEKMSKRHGQVLMPFAFGVAPLLQVIGTDIPSVPSSRAVQIPLFRLEAGLGERPIIDHVMVMLFPRADHGNASVCELTTGSSMLVMRNFGYLGLHSVIHSKSSLARDRLVDFTGEVQVRRRAENEEETEVLRGAEDADIGTFVVPPWRSQFVAEPTVNGGRNTTLLRLPATEILADGTSRNKSSHGTSDFVDESDSRSPLYAQELASVPLLLTPSVGRSVPTPPRVRAQQNGRSGASGEDQEPSFYSTFCNEMLCHPRLIHNCGGKNIVVKVELRDMEWSEDHNAYLAFLPNSGPSIHNPRRGPFLVQEAFTSCAYKTYNPHFMDEFKMKLPLILQQRNVGGLDSVAGGPSLLFSVYNIKLKTKKKWADRLSGKRVKSKGVRTPKRRGWSVDGDDFEGGTADEDEDHRTKFEFLGCGFLPITSDADPFCLIENGLHDVELTYTAKAPLPTRRLPPGTLLVSQMTSPSERSEMEPGSRAEVSSMSHTVSSIDTLEISGRHVVDTDEVLENSSFATESVISEGAGVDEVSINNSRADGAGLNSSRHSIGSWAADGRASPQLSTDKDANSRPTTPANSRPTTPVNSRPTTPVNSRPTTPVNSRPTTPANSRPTTPVSSRPTTPTRTFELKTEVDLMTLQVRIVMHSSVHPQNSTLSSFLCLSPGVPRPLTEDIMSVASPWRLQRDQLLRCVCSASAANMSIEEQNLLPSTVYISRPNHCSTPHRSFHLLRSLSQLWRTFVTGTGEPMLVWANPASHAPLRLHSFASLLHMLNSVSNFMAKSGVTQLDGRGEWNLAGFARVVAMMFDENTIFASSEGVYVEEAFNPKDWPSPASRIPMEKTASEKNDKERAQISKSQQGNTILSEGPKKANKKVRKRHVRSDNSWLSTEFMKQGITSPPGTATSSDSYDQLGSGMLSPSKTGEGLSFREKSMTLPHSLSSSTKKTPSSSKERSLCTDDFKKIFESDASPQSTGSATALGPGGGFKVDSKSDFQSALKASLSSSQDGLISHRPKSGAPRTSGTKAALDMINAYSGIGSNDRKRWSTMPLATIREETRDGLPSPTGSGTVSKNQTLASDDEANSPHGQKDGAGDTVDTELILHEKKQAPKQMRVPKRRNEISNSSPSSSPPKVDDKANPTSTMKTIPATDEAIEATGEAFFDVICKNFGYSGPEKTAGGGEEQRVGHAHHRKTRSRCSIDWTIPQTETLIENQQQLGQIGRRGDVFSSPLVSKGVNDISQEREVSQTNYLKSSTAAGEFYNFDDSNTSMTSLVEEERHTYSLPSFVDRLIKLGEMNGRGRWFPFTYEVIIFQWVALLVEQRRTGGKTVKVGSSSNSVESGSTSESTPISKDSADRNLTMAASKARGVVIACAPVLFEIIKKSLGWRIHNLLRRTRSAEKEPYDSSLLVTLDAALLDALEQIIAMLTDACIDSRNFESWEFRQTSFDVNDSIVRFLRDMFGFLNTRSAYRLVMVYFSRFVTKEGKQWKDRDSSIGLRSTWEISKLRLNAITAFIRFPDFVRVCSPHMDTWDDWPLTAPASATRAFFSNALNQLEKLAVPGFAAAEVPGIGSTVEIPSLKPHWLAELAVDICLCGTEHVEHSIQHRAASLLHELFWTHSQQGQANGTSSALATMYVPLLLKLLDHITYLSSFAAKHQLRKDIMPCAAFVLEFAPAGLLRGVWRKLCIRAEGKGVQDKYGGIVGTHVSTALEGDPGPYIFDADKDGREPDIFDMFSLLNLALSTFEYEGCDEHVEAENEADANDQRAVWQKEFLPAQEHDGYSEPSNSLPTNGLRDINKTKKQIVSRYSTSTSRKWHAHDGSLVIVNTSHQIVREMLSMLRPSADASSEDAATSRPNLHNSVGDSTATDVPKSVTSGAGQPPGNHVKSLDNDLKFSLADTVIFVRAATSLYLHALALNESDIVIIKTLNASVEIVKIFGIKIFLEAVGETLQHWMRVVSVQCGARRAEVRIEATEFLALILRLTWDTYGSFYRIRLPLIAVQTEVMERIVATAASRFYREQRREGTAIQSLSNDSAEASLSPLWRTLDRLHHQPASQNIAFRSALIRLAEKLKKLFQAYIAAHALGILTRARSPLSPSKHQGVDPKALNESSVLSQKSRVSVHRIVSASAGFSKQFLGLHGSSPQRDTVAHNEAVEDAFLAAADVFSPTELPSHRVAWLRRLADFHASREKFAEEATCRFHIHVTFRQAARLHDCLWSSMPFLPWTGDETHVGGEGPTGELGDYYDADDDDLLSADDYGMLETESRKQIDFTHSFRRIFYRVASSVRMRTGEWEIGGNKNLFYGVTLASEYGTITPWMSLREVEEGMVEEAETAGDLYLKAGIVESSRYAWSLATQFYAETFNYAKLAYVYKRLALVVASQIPVVDASNQLELSSPLGRFYRVWFHGGAPDELIGAEFVYRTAGSVKLERFGKNLCAVVRSILPETTPIDLLLDDGRPEDTSHRKKNARRPLGASIEPVRIKITPLRPLIKRANTIRGTPEWFYRYTDLPFDGSSTPPSTQHYGSGASVRRNTSYGDDQSARAVPRHREHTRSLSASIFASGSVSAGGRSFRTSRSGEVVSRLRDESYEKNLTVMGGGAMIGVDTFSFMQPIDKDRHRATRDWLRAQSTSIAEKSLRVTELQVEQSFPACVARQKVVHRTVFTQSPLEAGMDAVCSWCAVLFRTGVATNGMAVKGNQMDQGIGTAAAKVVADCIHSSRVKEIGLSLLKSEYVADEDNGNADGTIMMTYTKLSAEEWENLKKKLARAVVIFLELLHLLIARNRNLLLAVVDARKRKDGGSSVAASFSRKEGNPTVTSSPESTGHRFGPGSLRSGRSSSFNDGMASSYGDGYSKGDDATPSACNLSVAGSTPGLDKTDSAIAIQSELQRAYISMMRSIYPSISQVLRSETPRWLKSCCQESYFSTAGFRQTKLPMGEELFFFGGDLPTQSDSPQKNSHRDRDVPVAIVSSFSPTNEHEVVDPNLSQHESLGTSSIISEPSKQQVTFPPKTHLHMYQSA